MVANQTQPLSSLLETASWQAPLREQDRLLPAANVGRVMASILPENAKISRDARHFMQEVVTEFICFLTSEVNDRCLAEKRRIMTVHDYIAAARSLDLEEYAEVLSIALPYIERCSAQCGKRVRAP